VEGEQARLDALRDILHKGLSVRQAESISKRKVPRKSARRGRSDPNIRAVEERLSKSLGTRVSIQPARKRGAGAITIPYSTLEDLDRILDLLFDKAR
jgi:ParB family chromosome partitioning protein